MFDIDIYEEFPIIGLARNNSEPKPYELIGILKITECKLNDLSKQIDALQNDACTYTDYYAGSFIFNEIKSAYEDLKNKYPNANELDIDGTKRCIMDEFARLTEAIRKFKDEVNTIWVNICCYNSSSESEEESKSIKENQEDSIDDYIDDLSLPFDFKLTFSKLPICKYASILSNDENEWDYDKTISIIKESVEMADNIYHRLHYRYINRLLTTYEFFAVYDIYRRIQESIISITEISLNLIYIKSDPSNRKFRTDEFNWKIAKIHKAVIRINLILSKFDIDPDKIEILK